MIIVGYQGIGKSSISNRDSGCVDLESGNFWVCGKRSDDWFIPYCNIADHLSKQGYIVFTSSHEVVRNQLKKSGERKAIICPSLMLRGDWIKRLEGRYNTSGLEKDYKALMNAYDKYNENISDLLSEDGYEHIVIEDMDYDLSKLIQQF